MKVPPFIRKLKLILQTIQPEIAGWNEDGNIFEVCDAKSFASELSRHFKGNEQTFIRQLHFYGFTKLDCTRNLRKLEKPLPPALPGAWSFSHPLLLRDSLDLMDSIVRNSDKKNGATGANFDSNEDFEEDDNITINTRELTQLRKKNRDLESAVEALQAKLAILTVFLEKEGYDAQSIVSSDSQLRKKTRYETSFDMSYDTGLSNKRGRLEFEFSPLSSFQRQTSVDLFFQPTITTSESSESSNEFDDSISAPFISIFDDHNLSLQPNSEAENVSLLQHQNKHQSNSIDALADTLSRNISLDSGFNHSVCFNNVGTIDEVIPPSISAAAFEAEKLQIDSETVSKVIMHLKEALNAAMNAEVCCDTKSECFNDPFSTYPSNQRDDLNSSSSSEEETKPLTFSPSSSSLMSSSLTPFSEDFAQTKRTVGCCEELNGKSLSLLLPLLLSLPQIKDALKANNLSIPFQGHQKFEDSFSAVVS